MRLEKGLFYSFNVLGEGLAESRRGQQEANPSRRVGLGHWGKIITQLDLRQVTLEPTIQKEDWPPLRYVYRTSSKYEVDSASS